MGFFREVFSEDGQGSASRVMMGLHAIAGVAFIAHVVIHNHAIPDAVTMSGLTAFVVAPYAVNKAHAAITAFTPNNKAP